MTVCANCGTSQGPFTRDPDFPGLPVCGFTRRHRADANMKEKRVAECNSRRVALENKT